MRSRIERTTTGTMIVITGLKNMGADEKDHIFDGIVEHCCKNLSTNELKEIVRQIEVEQLGGENPCDIPPTYREMLQKVKEVIKKRPNCHCQCCCPQEATKLNALGDCPSSTRPYFGDNQVRYMSQLKMGQAYYDVNVSNGTYKTRFILTREPYFKNGGWWIDVEANGSYGKRKDSHSLADHSVVPYKGDIWNTRNYITFAEPAYTSRHHSGCCHSYHCQCCCC